MRTLYSGGFARLSLSAAAMKRASILAAFAVVPTLAFGDTIVGGTSASFPSTPITGTPTSGNQGSPYWNDASLDGTNQNVGYFLTGTGGFSGGTNYNPTTQLTNGTANPINASTAFDFLRDSTTDTLVMLGAFSNFGGTAAGTPDDVVGWYETDSTGTVNGTKHQLFAGGTEQAAVGQSFAFNPTSFYGFYLTTCVTLSGNTCTQSATYYTNTSFDTVTEYSNFVGGTSVVHQHFAEFGGSGESYFIGIEDGSNTFGAEAYGDFNDVIFQVQATAPAVPEPATFGMVGAGLVALFLQRRRLARIGKQSL